MPRLDVSMYDVKSYEVNEDCDHGPCVGINIDHGGGPVTIWLFTDTMEQRDELYQSLSTNMTDRAQLVDY